MADLTHLWKAGQAIRCRMDGILYKGTIKEVFPDHVLVDVPEISDHIWFEEGLNMGDLYPEYNFNSDGDHIWSDAALKKAEETEESDEPRICGIMYDHGNGVYSLGEGFVLTAEEEKTIQDILDKYIDEGWSFHGTKKEIAEEILEVCEPHAEERKKIKVEEKEQKNNNNYSEMDNTEIRKISYEECPIKCVSCEALCGKMPVGQCRKNLAQHFDKQNK